MMTYKFVADGFKAPFQVKRDNYILRKLSVDEVEKDYAAVMSSKESLRQIFEIDDDWPADDMTIEENYNDLLDHQNEFDSNKGFAYTIVVPDDSRCIGCLYIYPFRHGVYDSVIYYWFTDDVKNKMDPDLRNFLNHWIGDTFELKNPAYPGRDISHKQWPETIKLIKNGSLK